MEGGVQKEGGGEGGSPPISYSETWKKTQEIGKIMEDMDTLKKTEHRYSSKEGA